MACLRLARGANDYLGTAIFLRELHHSHKDVLRTLYADMRQFKEDAVKHIMEASLSRWIETHTIDFWGSEDESADGRRNLLKVTVGEIDQELSQWEKVISDMLVPQGMSPFDLAAFTDSNQRQKAEIRLRMRALHQIKTRVKAKCFDYAVQMERQLSTQEKNESFFQEAQNTVNNYFKAESEDVFMKLRKASELALSADTEDAALLLTEVRRTLKAVADHFYPPQKSKTLGYDGIERSMGEEQYLNRLQQYLSQRLKRDTAQELLLAELGSLSAFLRRLNEMASKGVHANATLAEAKQGLIGLYFFLFNLCQQLVLSEPEGTT